MWSLGERISIASFFTNSWKPEFRIFHAMPCPTEAPCGKSWRRSRGRRSTKRRKMTSATAVSFCGLAGSVRNTFVIQRCIGFGCTQYIYNPEGTVKQEKLWQINRHMSSKNSRPSVPYKNYALCQSMYSAVCLHPDFTRPCGSVEFCFPPMLALLAQKSLERLNLFAIFKLCQISYYSAKFGT